MKALIENNKISGIVTDDHLGGHLIDLPENFDAQNMHKYIVVDGVAVIPPPTAVTMRQARLALLNAGLLTYVNTFVAGASQAAQIEWEFAATVDRSSALVITLQTALVLTNQEMDDLFILAATL